MAFQPAEQGYTWRNLNDNESNKKSFTALAVAGWPVSVQSTDDEDGAADDQEVDARDLS
ncbi:MAG TPA: hypothetical protein VKR06_00035 [Ktedonosporobacter sp.]|nr:hypothetical protein [Ktedonosporobacter sp.]